jgi:aminopeptidase YwaD
MKTRTALPLVLTLFAAPSRLPADEPPLLRPEVGRALAAEVSGESAKRNLEALVGNHRMRGSRGFRAAADHIAAQLRAYGLPQVEVLSLPADGTQFYGTQKARPAWDAEFAELWELDGEGRPRVRLGSWESMPLTLAQDSESADVKADLVDVGDGTREADYAGKEVRGRIVLAAAQPSAVERLAVEARGAAGIVSYAQNQRTAWWGENENLLRWGHLDSFPKTPTFAFMVTPKQARQWKDRLARGERVPLHAVVKAGRHPGSYDIVTAVIPGADPARRNEEIVFSCHLDHPRPGANDNASGCATILEVARSLAGLVREGRVPAPVRTVRFVWPPEIEGTLALLNGRPEIASRVKAAIHLDMVGGGPETKAVFHVTRGPASLPSFAYDVAEALGEFVNRETDAFAAGRRSDYPLAAREGGKEGLAAQMSELSLGSDHQVYSDSSWGIPALYFNDWPDRYIHTNFDTSANIDPTKLQRAAFLAASAGYVLATVGPDDAPALWETVRARSLRRAATALERRAGLSAADAAALVRFQRWYERRMVDSLERFMPVPQALRTQADAHLALLDRLWGATPAPLPAPVGPGAVVYVRNPKVKGTVSAFGYEYLEDHYAKASELKLPAFVGLRGGGGDYAYEVLNLVDGRRTAAEIRDAVSAIYGPVPLEHVVEYLQALRQAGLTEEKR